MEEVILLVFPHPETTSVNVNNKYCAKNLKLEGANLLRSQRNFSERDRTILYVF